MNAEADSIAGAILDRRSASTDIARDRRVSDRSRYSPLEVRMARNILSAVLVSAVALPLLLGSAGAADVKWLGTNPTSDELISALTLQPAAPAMKLRGAHQLQAKPAAEPEARAPAVALDIKFNVNTAEL